MKNDRKFLFTFPAILIAVALSCSSLSPEEKNISSSDENLSNDFKSYWYQGKSEVSHYQLTQARYGELRDSSQAILIFVTEDFLTDKQVKSDNAGKGTSVLKLNFIKRFVTGIYDYSMMTSVFTPVNREEFPNTMKITSSSQDWCGQTFMQMNFKNNQYHISSLSYFESEGDENITLDKTLLEDEIWSLIRISPENLPQEKIKIIPGTIQSRLRHKKLSVEDAVASIETVKGNEKINCYTVSYPESERVLKIFYEKEFPYMIIGWEETYKDGFGDKAKVLTTKATLKKSVLTDYWTKNSIADSLSRKQLGL